MAHFIYNNNNKQFGLLNSSSQEKVLVKLKLIVLHRFLVKTTFETKVNTFQNDNNNNNNNHQNWSTTFE